MKNRTKKILAVALLVMACTVVGSLISTQPILNRGIVVGMGIDKTEQNEIEVTVQIAVAGESSAPGAPNRYALVNGKAKTLLAAMERISRITAYKPAYFHCHMLIFGEKLVREGLKETATELFIEDSVMDDVAVMAVQGTAKETLERSVSMQGASSVYLQQLNKINSSTGGHPASTLKNFITDFETKGNTPFLPWVEALPVPKAVGGADTGGDEQNYVFDCSKTVLFLPSGKGIVTDEKVTDALGLTSQPDGMFLPIKTAEGNMDVQIKKSLMWWSVGEDGCVTFRATYFVGVLAQNIAESASDLTDDYVTETVKEHISDILTSVRAEYESSEADPYSLQGKYHKKFGEKKEPESIAFRLKLTIKRSDA